MPLDEQAKESSEREKGGKTRSWYPLGFIAEEEGERRIKWSDITSGGHGRARTAPCFPRTFTSALGHHLHVLARRLVIAHVLLSSIVRLLRSVCDPYHSHGVVTEGD
jgi:hypothetical protein